MSQQTILYWHRQDLRLKDNPALNWAASHGEVVPIYIKSKALFKRQYIGEAQHWWLHHSLQSLKKDYDDLDVNLILKSGEDSEKIIRDLLKQTAAKTIVWNRCYDPASIEHDAKLKKTLQEDGFEVKTFNASLLTEPSQIKNKSGDYFKVFTPFWKESVLQLHVDNDLTVPKLSPASKKYESDNLDDWKLLPSKPNWAVDFGKYWQPGEHGAKQKLQEFIKQALSGYGKNRDIPGINGTSRLSPHLKFGEISPKQIWNAVKKLDSEYSNYDLTKYTNELGWREFSYYLLYHFKKLEDQPFNANFSAFPWSENAKFLKAWQKGLTGYPMVDAGMRELWHTGWMHNRVRMIVGSFLTKHLLLPWQEGAKWFHYTLLDGDIASNSASWQWVSGCGADAAPYFRIFNPITQGKKFDPEGNYVRKWVPELAKLPDNIIHEPWEASDKMIASCDVSLGQNYPKPIVDHFTARNKALKAYEKIKKSP